MTATYRKRWGLPDNIRFRILQTGAPQQMPADQRASSKPTIIANPMI